MDIIQPRNLEILKTVCIPPILTSIVLCIKKNPSSRYSFLIEIVTPSWALNQLGHGCCNVSSKTLLLELKSSTVGISLATMRCHKE